MRRRQHAFTLVEILVVIAIIAVLIAMLFPMFSKSREASLRVQCASNMRTIGQAVIAYAVNNKGKAPLKGGPIQYPYEWNKTTMVNPLMRYGLNLRVMTCPSMYLCNPPVDNWTGHMDTNAETGDYIVNYQYLVGLGDADTVKNLSGGKWYENPPQVASKVISRGPVRIMLVDMNMMFSAADNGFNFYGSAPSVRWFYSSHAVRNRFDPGINEVRSFVKGSNRLYTDGHVQWALPDQMGRGDQIITANVNSARYSHNGDVRPYWW